MAVAKDAVSRFTGTGTGTLSWTHTPVGTPRGVVVGTVCNEGVNQISSVTYGGVACAGDSTSRAVKATAEDGEVRLFTLGASVPTGAQTVEVLVSGAAAKTAFCVTVTAADDVEVVDVDNSINSDSQSNPSGTLSLGGRSSFVVQVFFSGQDTLGGITPLSGWTADYEVDFGAQTGGWYSYNTVGTSDVTFGWTQTAEDALCVAVAIGEVVAASGQPTVSRLRGVPGARLGGQRFGRGW